MNLDKYIFIKMKMKSIRMNFLEKELCQFLNILMR